MLCFAAPAVFPVFLGAGLASGLAFYCSLVAVFAQFQLFAPLVSLPEVAASLLFDFGALR